MQDEVISPPLARSDWFKSLSHGAWKNLNGTDEFSLKLLFYILQLTRASDICQFSSTRIWEVLRLSLLWGRRLITKAAPPPWGEEKTKGGGAPHSAANQIIVHASSCFHGWIKQHLDSRASLGWNALFRSSRALFFPRKGLAKKSQLTPSRCGLQV